MAAQTGFLHHFAAPKHDIIGLAADVANSGPQFQLRICVDRLYKIFLVRVGLVLRIPGIDGAFLVVIVLSGQRLEITVNTADGVRR